MILTILVSMMMTAAARQPMLAGAAFMRPIAAVPAVRIQGDRDQSGSGDLVSRDGRFRVTLPSGFPKPSVHVNNVKGDNGTIKIHLYSSVHEDLGLCIVSYCDFVGATIDSALQPKVLDGAKEGALANMEASLVDERVIAIGRHPGRSMRFTAVRDSQTMHGRIDFYLVGSRLYQVCFMGLSEEALAGRDVAGYFASFNLLSTEPAPRGRRSR